MPEERKFELIIRAARQARTPIPPRVVLEITTGICNGLNHAHSATGSDGQPLGLVHRDLKPGNIMISRTGEVKIMDFGIAKATSNLYKTTAADVTKGTPVYMSPEHEKGNFGRGSPGPCTYTLQQSVG